MVVPLEHKLNAMYSFVKSHLRTKSILFMVSCSQVRHAGNSFVRFSPAFLSWRCTASWHKSGTLRFTSIFCHGRGGTRT